MYRFLTEKYLTISDDDILSLQEAWLFQWDSHSARRAAENYTYAGDKENATKWFKKSVKWWMEGKQRCENLAKKGFEMLVWKEEWMIGTKIDENIVSAVLSEDKKLIRNVADEAKKFLQGGSHLSKIKYNKYSIGYIGYILTQMILMERIEPVQNIKKVIEKSKKRTKYR